MARRRGQLPAVPKPLLPLPLLSGSHCHSPSLISNRFQNQTNFDFRHGLLKVREYLVKKFQLDPNYVGTMPMGAVAS